MREIETLFRVYVYLVVLVLDLHQDTANQIWSLCSELDRDVTYQSSLMI